MGGGAPPSQDGGEETSGTSAAAAADASTASANATNPKLRKRTKTGCLTCRKRRIKCGEERPTCNNCIKSKRHCEGYSQRVIFKTPLGDWPGPQNTTNTMQFHTGMLPGGRQPYAPPPQPQMPTPDLTPIQPRPGGGFMFPLDENGRPLPLDAIQPSGLPYGVPMFSPSTAQQYQYGIAFSGGQIQNVNPGASQQPFQQYTFVQPQVSPNLQHFQQQQSFHPPADVKSQQLGQQTSAPQTTAFQHFYPTSNDSKLVFKDESQSPQSPYVTPTSSNFSQQPFFQTQTQSIPHPTITPTTAPYYDGTSVAYQPSIDVPNEKTIVSPTATRPQSFQGKISTGGFGAPHLSPTQVLEEAAVEYEDDDYYDVQSDEEMEIPPGQLIAYGNGNQHDLQTLFDLHRSIISDMSMRRYDSFIYQGILDRYRAEWVASPLRNPKTARVFAHFITATGPSLSIFERNPRNTSAIFGDGPVPVHQQGLWTSILPMMALNHQGLLHAMLALASLHIAKLQGASVTPSFKHYAYALKRIHHCVGHPRRRHQATTVAATLLLGFYEVMTADHLKWNSHLLGAKQLIVEINYVGMTREARRMRTEKQAHEETMAFQYPEMALNYRDASTAQREFGTMVDENLVSTLVGRKLRYDEFGHVIEDPPQRHYRSSLPPQLDVSLYELYQDLFWWFTRQDAYQSILSGNRLLMDYSRWTDCPPRAPMGKPDAVYGTHDHLVLLLGRIADFASRDRSRKLRVIEKSGGVWRPSPDMPGFPPGSSRPSGPPGSQSGQQQMPGTPVTGPPPGYGPPNPQMSSSFPQGPPHMPPQGSQGPPQQSQMPLEGPPPGTAPPQMPTFYGMAPSRENPHAPSAYYQESSYQRSPPQPSPPRDADALAAATSAAIEEWNQIRAALNVFASHFGSAFQPLSAEYHQPLQTPFGPALHYRSYDIGVLWALYYMCQIILTRSHPAMPPASMMAAGVAAAQTAHLSAEVGRVAGGIAPTPRSQPLNPSLGAALCEATLPLFFAGVQYQEQDQRFWLVDRVLDTESRTGWASAGLIAHGCETAWEKAAEMGRGPPYRREERERAKERSGDERLRYSSAARLRKPSATMGGVRPNMGIGAGVDMDTGRGLGGPGPVKEEAGEGAPKDLSDRSYVYVNPATRLHWAMGLLSVDDDVVEIDKAEREGDPSGQSPGG